MIIRMMSCGALWEAWLIKRISPAVSLRDILQSNPEKVPWNTPEDNLGEMVPVRLGDELQ
jgi:hypothetical protein